MFTVTEDWIRNHASNPDLGVGWTKKQILLLGVGTHYGWIGRAVGTPITLATKARFEAIGIGRKLHLRCLVPINL